MTEPCAPINEGIYKKKKPLIFRDFLGTFIKYYKISQLIHTQIIAN